MPTLTKRLSQANAKIMTPEAIARLERLDREMTPDGKRFDHLYATHAAHRIRICVERLIDRPRHHVTGREYRATAEFAGRRHYGYGIAPSHAFLKVREHLSWAVSRYEFDRNFSNNNAKPLTLVETGKSDLVEKAA